MHRYQTADVSTINPLRNQKQFNWTFWVSTGFWRRAHSSNIYIANNQYFTDVKINIYYMVFGFRFSYTFWYERKRENDWKNDCRFVYIYYIIWNLYYFINCRLYSSIYICKHLSIRLKFKYRKFFTYIYMNVFVVFSFSWKDF